MMADEIVVEEVVTDDPPVETGPTVRESLEAAYDELTKSSELETAPTAGSEPKPVEAAAPASATAEKPTAVEGDQPPAALTGEAKAKWASCPPEWKAEISRLSSDMSKAAGKYGEEAKFAAAIRAEFEPYRGIMQQYNATEMGTLRSALGSIGILTSGTAEQKAAEVLGICRTYGIDHTKLASVPAPDPALEPLHREIGDLRGTVSTLTAAQQEFYRQQADTDIKQFLASGDRPHFELVRGQMATLMANKMAQTLSDAYEQAVMLVPEAREAYLNSEIETRRAKAVEEANRVKLAATSQRGKPLSGSMPKEEPNSIRASLEKAWDELTT
jgi:hypothetical protein